MNRPLLSFIFFAVGFTAKAQVEMPLYSMTEVAQVGWERMEYGLDNRTKKVAERQDRLEHELEKLQAREAALQTRVEQLTRRLASIDQDSLSAQSEWEDRQIEVQSIETALMRAHLDLGQQKVRVQSKWTEIADVAYLHRER